MTSISMDYIVQFSSRNRLQIEPGRGANDAQRSPIIP
jgi:hypothetical protein